MCQGADASPPPAAAAAVAIATAAAASALRTFVVVLTLRAQLAELLEDVRVAHAGLGAADESFSRPSPKSLAL